MTQETQRNEQRPSTTVRPRMAVVVPMANEEATVDKFVGEVLQHLSERDHLFCVLDNVTQDSTRDRLNQLAARDPRVEVIWAPENRCVVDAYFRGYRAALEANYDWILEMDAGMSHDPGEIPRVIAAMQQGVDFAAGSRFIQGGKHHGPPFRYLVSWGGTILTNLLLGTRMKDMTSGFECFTHRALSHVVAKGVRSRAHFFQTEIRTMLHGWRWVEVPIHYRTPTKHIGGDSLSESFRVLWALYKERRAKPSA